MIKHLSIKQLAITVAALAVVSTVAVGSARADELVGFGPVGVVVDPAPVPAPRYVHEDYVPTRVHRERDPDETVVIRRHAYRDFGPERRTVIIDHDDD